ncbi:CPBP family intramembrane glutamic endopeptidase [Sphingomonas sp. UYP23]
MKDGPQQMAVGAITLFLALVAIMSLPLDLLLIRAGRLDIGRGFPIHTLMWVPAVAALITCLAYKVELGFLGLSRFATRRALFGYLLVCGYSLTTFLLLWLTNLAPLDWHSFALACGKLYGGNAGAPVLTILFTLTFGVVQSAASALGEEIGWRGFLVPALRSRLGMGSTLVASGLIWAVWHFPLTIFSDYGGGAPLPYQLCCFTIMIVATGAIYGLLRLKSGSVWPAVVMHAVHNAAIQWLLDPMTVETGRATWYAGEFGAGLALVTAVFALAMLARERQRHQGGGEITE